MCDMRYTGGRGVAHRLGMGKLLTPLEEQGVLVSALLAPADLHAARADAFLASFKRLVAVREKPPLSPPIFFR